MKVDNCVRGISGFEIKNTFLSAWGGGSATGKFRVSGSLKENGPWQPLVEAVKAVDNNLVNFTFDKPVGVQFLRFDLLSYNGDMGALQYFAPISAIQSRETSECGIFST